jgi:ribonuclease HI
MTSWVHGWARKGWRRTGGAIENLELWHDAIRAAEPHQVEWRWVRGHAGHPQNEYANHLATRAAAAQTTSDGLVDSDFDAWVAAQRTKGVVRGTATPFPDAATFRAASALPRVPTGG